LGELRDALQSLLESRGLAQPDGRPLYAYRFARSDFDQIGAILRRFGSSAVGDRHGAALIVSHVAEWFRRERSGGHWDWIRPLRAIGLDYGPYARIQYRDVESLVSLGLRVWRRPEPTGGERLLAIVREAGFPVASVREDPRISSWLKNSVLCAERGFSTRDAVGAEAWRVSDRLAQALFDPAVDLCDKIIDLRASLPPTEARGDPVDYLDQNRLGWRDQLPFDVECEDIRSMVEQIVRLRDDGAAALDVSRHLVRADDEWQARASLGLSGRIDLRRLPSSVAEAVLDGRRVRIFPRPPFCQELIAVAAIETYEKDDAPAHELRAFVAKFDSPLALGDEARLLVQSGSNTVGEFIAAGGEPLHDPVIALQIEQVDENESPTRLRVLGSSSARTSRPALALAVRDEHFHSVSFSAGFTDLGRCAGDRRVVSFSGSAAFTLAGARSSWKTSAEREVDSRPILVGNLVRNVRESVFRGMPKLWIEREGHLASPRRQTLHWRPRGRGTWRSVDGSKPWGNVDLAVIENGELLFAIGASIVPPNFDLAVDRGRREFRVTGLDTRLLVARGSNNLDVRFEGEMAIVRLGPPTGASTIVLRPRWDAELALTFADPNYDLRLIDANEVLVPPRSTFSVDGLKGLRILATREVSLCMELRANDAPRLTITRRVSGEVPLSAFADTITQLLGSSESLDARVELSTIGATANIADVRWYAEDVDPFDAPPPNAFSVLATTHGLDLQGISLAHPAAGTVSLVAPASQVTMRAELSRALPPGPWLIYGRRRQGTKVRPRIVPAAARAATGEETLLERAIGIDASAARAAAFVQAYAQPEQVAPRDRRTITDALNEWMTTDPAAELCVVLHGDPTNWDFDAWPMAPVVERWGARGRKVTVEVDRAALERADAVTRRRIALWIERARASLCSLPRADAEILAVVTATDRAFAWASLDREAYLIGSGWASTSGAPVVRGKWERINESPATIDSRSLLVERVRETIFELYNELDGPVTGFGQRLKALMIGRNETLAAILSEPCNELRYSDRYLFSPLVVRLVAELFAGFANANTAIFVDTLVQRRDNRRPRIGKTLKDDWPDVADRNVVFQHLLSQIAPTGRLVLHQDVPHRRRLDFRTPRGSGTIFFDQGVGSWVTASVVAFDPMAPIADQLRAVDAPFVVENGPNGTFFTSRVD
jgi:hypothetical protein